MRELEVRAWVDKSITQEENGFMHYANDNSVYELVSNGAGFSMIVDHEEWIESGHIDVMQYTGENDQDGNKIFRGDILSAPGEYNSQVVYASGSFCIQHITGWSPSCTPLRDIDTTCYKIIGNEHENPELLEIK